MKSHACFRVSVDEVAQDFAKYAELAKTRTFEIYDEGKVEVMLVRISAVPEWHRQLQKSIRTDMLTQEEWEMFMTAPEDLSHLPESYDDWEDPSE
jgi:PhoPQ-activated pathogenicity-related protein